MDKFYEFYLKMRYFDFAIGIWLWGIIFVLTIVQVLVGVFKRNKKRKKNKGE